MTISNLDFRKLFTEFGRVYDPFGTNETTRSAVTYTALLLYKLSVAAGIPLTK